MVKVGMSLFGAADVINSFQYVLGKFKAPADWVVGTNVEYSAFVEFGTSSQKAQPYLRPALAKVKRNMGRIVSAASSLNEALRDLALAIEAEAKRLVPVDTGTLKGSIKAVKR
jgi:hypothetical protein